MDANKLFELATKSGLVGRVVLDVNEALQLAKQESSPEDLIVVGGSTFVVAEVNEI
jgi:dihydrofolate synthase/folylpolyglutamate synthase